MLKLSQLLSLILIGLLTMGCNPLTNITTAQNSNLIEANLNSPFQLKVNQEAVIKSENIKIKFLSVEEDSRCPLEVQCVWPGQVKILVQVIHQQKDLGKFDLIKRVGEEHLAIKAFDGYSLKLIKLSPQPDKNRELNISDYLATLEVKQNSSQN